MRADLALEARDAAGRTVALTVPSPNFHLAPDESIHPALGPDFRATWTGSVEIVEAGAYEFSLGTGVGGAARGGDASIAVAGTAAGARPVELPPGEHPIRIEFARRTEDGAPGPAALRLLWKTERTTWEPVPLAALRVGPSPPPDLARGDAIERGRDRVEALRCAACHAPSPDPAAGRRPRPARSLKEVGARLRPEWPADAIADPARHSIDGAAPGFPLNEAERAELAAFLAAQANLGSPPPSPIPPFAVDRGQAGRGQELFETAGCAACHGAGGAALGAVAEKWRPAALAEFLTVQDNPRGAFHVADMKLSASDAKRLVSFLASGPRNPAAPRADAAEETGAAGAAIANRFRCIACHDFGEGAVDIEHSGPRPPAALPPLASLDVSAGPAGCIAPVPRPDAPHYALSDIDRAAIVAYLASLRDAPDVSPAPVHETWRTLDRLRCAACHELGARGPERPLGETPPPLTGVGAKLSREGLDGVLRKRDRARGWMELRMPHFGDAAAELPRGLIAIEGLDPDAAELAPLPLLAGGRGIEDLAEEGVGLVGSDGEAGGLSCVSCHDFGDREGSSERGPDLKRMAGRLRFSWFSRWMRAPARIRSGTSMPAFFETAPPNETNAAVAALWAALKLGREMPDPPGLAPEDGPDPYARPVPTDRAIVRRTFLEGVTPAAIAVGMPGGVSYCFDAGESRLAFVWSGGFVDLAPHWDGKGKEAARIVGHVFHRETRFPFRFGAPDATDDPPREFLGYRLVGGYPEFRYRVRTGAGEAAGEEARGDAVFRERIEPLGGDDGFVRTFEMDLPTAVWFVPPGETDEGGTEAFAEGGQAEPNGTVRLGPGTGVRLRVEYVRGFEN